MRNHALIMKPRLTFYSNLIKIPVFKDMVFWSLNVRFMPNRTGDIFRVCRDASDNNKVFYFYATDSSSRAARQNKSKINANDASQKL